MMKFAFAALSALPVIFCCCAANAETIEPENARELVSAIHNVSSCTELSKVTYTIDSSSVVIDGAASEMNGTAYETDDGAFMVPSQSVNDILSEICGIQSFYLADDSGETDIEAAAELYGFDADRSGNEITLSFPFSTLRLLAAPDVKDNRGAENTIIMPDGSYIFCYDTYEDTKNAYEYYVSTGADVVPDEIITLESDESDAAHVGWGADYIESDAFNAALLRRFGSVDNMDPVSVAVIDSGVDYNHTLLNGRIDKERGYDIFNDDNDPMDVNGHGTHVSGIICDSTLENVSIIPYKITGTEGTSSISFAISAVYMAIEDGADVINMSLGSSDPNLSIKSHMSSCITKAMESGIIVVSAAGNSKENTSAEPDPYIFDTAYCCPANIDGVITVSACDKNGSFAKSYSNRGEEVSICAPGTSVYSSMLNNKYGYKSGTSMACPYASSVCAMMKTADREITQSEAKRLLEISATDAGEEGFDIYYGNGILNAGRIPRYLYSSDQKFISVSLNNGTLTIGIDNSDKIFDDQFRLVIAKRNSGALLSCEIIDIAIPDTNKNAVVEYPGFNSTGCDEIDLYLLDSLENLIPLSVSYNLNLSGQQN